MTFSQTLTYLGSELDHHGAPHQWFHYLTIAKPDGEEGAIATIVPLSEAIAQGVPRGPIKIVNVSGGGTAAALKEAEKYLDDQHVGLRKHAAEPQPHG